MAEDTIRKITSGRHVIIIDITEAIEMLINNDIIMSIDLESPILTVIDILTFKYPFIDNTFIALELLEIYGKYDEFKDDDVKDLVSDLLHDVGLSIYNELLKYFNETDIMTINKLCWVNDRSIAFIL